MGVSINLCIIRGMAAVSSLESSPLGSTDGNSRKIIASYLKDELLVSMLSEVGRHARVGGTSPPMSPFPVCRPAVCISLDCPCGFLQV